MIKIYGMRSCPDCEFILGQIKNDAFEYIEIGSDVKFLKEFLRIRDREPIFNDCRESGSAGIPCFLLENGTVTLTPEDVGLRSRAGSERASELAKKEFAGRTDKSGKDYWEAHLCTVASLVNTDSEKTVAYLHDILEDTDYPESSLRYEFGNMITDAVLLLTHQGHPDEKEYLDYIRRLKESENTLAITVKIADLTNNSDYTRLGAKSPDELSPKDRKRVEKYQKALQILKD